MTDWVRIYPPPDDPDEIAREIAQRHGPAMSGGGRVLAEAIAAALRAYGASQRNAGLEEIEAMIEANSGDTVTGGEIWVYRHVLDYVRSIKSTPESKP